MLGVATAVLVSVLLVVYLIIVQIFPNSALPVYRQRRHFPGDLRKHFAVESKVSGSV